MLSKFPIPTILLWSCGFTFLGVGLAFFLIPADLLAKIGVTVNTPSGRAEIRAVYGGLEMGVGLFLVWSARSSERWVSGLTASLMTFVFLAGARAVGIILERADVTPLHWALLGIELLGASLSYLGLKTAANGRQD